MKRLVLLLPLLAACADGEEPLLVGTLERDRVALAAELSEPVIAVHVHEGDEVVAGQLLLELDPARAEAERARLAALAEQAQRRVDELLRGPREERVREARARLAAAAGLLENARQEFARIRQLQQEGLASAAALDAAQAALEARRGERDAAQATLEEMLEGSTVEELDQARAQLDAAQAALKAQELTLARLRVTAPRAGRVEALPYRTGAQPPRGADVAVLLAGELEARVHVPVGWRTHFAEGSAVTVHVPGHGDYAGTVRWVSAEAAFTPYYALTEHDRDRLSHAAEIQLGENAAQLPAGLPVDVRPGKRDE